MHIKLFMIFNVALINAQFCILALTLFLPFDLIKERFVIPCFHCLIVLVIRRTLVGLDIKSF